MSVAEATENETRGELYSHKLNAPQHFSGAIRRRAILDRLAGGDGARVVFLQGPAGHGKSTALQQLKSEIEAGGMLSAWLTLDSADNDLRRFSIHLNAALAPLLGAGAAGDPDGADASTRRRRSDWLIGQLLQMRQPVALFFDDFQAIEDKLILSFFRDLFERVPERIRVFVASRSIPEVGLARLLINRQATVLRSDDLRFSRDEVAEFFAADPELALRREEIDAIHRRTDGWPAALQLFRLALVSPSVRQSLGDLGSYRPRELAEYLVDNVLSLQSPRIQDFLLKTSVLTRLTAPLCEAVSGCGDSQALLLQLERSGLFVRSLDSDLRWFRYHPLFASFLTEQLREQSEEAVLDVHRRAAQWYLGQQLHEETVRHAVACRDFSLAADTMAIWFARLIADAQLVTVEHWCSQLPFEEIAKRRSLQIELAYALVFLRRYERLRPLVELLSAGGGADGDGVSGSVVLSMAAISADDIHGAFARIQNLEVRTPQRQQFSAFELGAAANLHGYRAMTLGDFEAAREYLALARAHNLRGEATFSAGYTIGVSGVSLMAQGQLPEALEIFRAGMAEQRMHLDKSFASAAVVSCYLWALYESDQLDRVESLFGQYRDIISASVLLDFLAVAYISVSRTCDARGRSAQALEMLDEAETLGHANGWDRLVRIINWERVRRSLLRGTLDRAVAIANHMPPPAKPCPADWVLFSEDIEGESIGRIRLAIHTQRYDEASRRLAAESAGHPGRTLRELKLLLLDAQLQDANGQRNAAHRSLRKALQLAQPAGFVRPFLDEGERVLRLLREEYQTVLDTAHDGDAAGHASKRGFVERLLQASGIDLSRTPVRAEVHAADSLTDREKEILTFLANGVSNKEMASRVFLSENTIKFHLKNIYSKLAVDSRLKAITMARQRGLIQ